MIDGLATAEHYVDHIAAVLSALPDAARGSVITSSGAVAERARGRGLSTVNDGPDNPVLVASFGDLRKAQSLGRTRIALMEHGAGQSYAGRAHAGKFGSYAGGTNRDGASLFLHPGPHPAARDRAAYPAARVEVVGAPHLDTLPRRKGAKSRVVAISFHFNGPLAPETRTAWPWIFPSIVKLVDRYEIIGHAHPRLFDQAAKVYRKFGIEPVREFTEVCERADVYVADNTSTLFAFAATKRPVVVLNPPYYDRRVNHGLRFEPSPGCPITDGLHYCGASHVGPQVNDPSELGSAIDAALEDTSELAAQREDALDLVYAYRTGAGKRAAKVLMDWAAQ